jgi:hypothetical protein
VVLIWGFIFLKTALRALSIQCEVSKALFGGAAFDLHLVTSIPILGRSWESQAHELRLDCVPIRLRFHPPQQFLFMLIAHSPKFQTGNNTYAEMTSKVDIISNLEPQWNMLIPGTTCKYCTLRSTNDIPSHELLLSQKFVFPTDPSVSTSTLNIMRYAFSKLWQSPRHRPQSSVSVSSSEHSLLEACDAKHPFLEPQEAELLHGYWRQTRFLRSMTDLILSKDPVLKKSLRQ